MQMRKKYGIAVIAEFLFLLCFLLYFGLQKRELVILGADEMNLVRVQADGIMVTEESCYYDRSNEAEEIYIESPAFCLDPGVY